MALPCPTLLCDPLRTFSSRMPLQSKAKWRQRSKERTRPLGKRAREISESYTPSDLRSPDHKRQRRDVVDKELALVSLLSLESRGLIMKLMDIGLLCAAPECRNCGGEVSGPHLYTGAGDWLCRDRNCATKHSVLVGSIFQRGGPRRLSCHCVPC